MFCVPKYFLFLNGEEMLFCEWRGTQNFEGSPAFEVYCVVVHALNSTCSKDDQIMLPGSKCQALGDFQHRETGELVQVLDFVRDPDQFLIQEYRTEAQKLVWMTDFFDEYASTIYRNYRLEHKPADCLSSFGRALNEAATFLKLVELDGISPIGWLQLLWISQLGLRIPPKNPFKVSEREHELRKAIRHGCYLGLLDNWDLKLHEKVLDILMQLPVEVGEELDKITKSLD